MLKVWLYVLPSKHKALSHKGGTGKVGREGRKEGHREQREREGRKGGRKGRRKEGRKEGRKERLNKVEVII
jgi:hypothetical protein